MNCDIPDFDRFLTSWISKKYLSTVPSFSLEDEKRLYNRVTIDPLSPDGPVLSKNDTYFLDVIEPWVQEMVLFFIRRLSLITYCSCEWHKHLSNQETWYIDERYIKALFLSEDERDKILKIFSYVIKTFSWDTWDIGITVWEFNEEYSWKLLSQKYIYCLQVDFPAKTKDVSKYFDSIENTYNTFLEYMKNFFEEKLWKE